MDTPCKECCFAIYEDVTQVGCAQGRIEKYQEVDPDAVLPVYDDDKEFFVIKDRLCPYFRTKEWLDQVGNNEEVIKDILRFETTLNFDIFLFLEKDHDLSHIEKTVHSILGQTVRPYRLFIVRLMSHKTPPQEISLFLEHLNIPFEWKISSWVDDDFSRLRVVKNLITNSKYSHFGTMCESGFVFPDEYLERINKLYIDELRICGMVVMDDEKFNGITCSKSAFLYWRLKGDPEKSMRANIEESQTKNDKQIIYSWKEILNITS